VPVEGAAYLEKLIADRLGAGRGQPPDGRRSSLDLAGIRGVAVGLVAAGVLGQHEMERIIADLEQTLVSTGWLTVARHEVGAAGNAARAGTVNEQWQAAIVDPPAPVLRKVFSLAGRTLVFGERSAVLLGLDVWSTMLTLRLAHEDGHAATNRRYRWRGWDDQGTQYRRAGSSGSGSHRLFQEQVVFEPGPADGARTLTLHVESDGVSQQLTIPLDGALTADERTTLEHVLDAHRHAVLRALDDLRDDDAAATLLPATDMTIGGIVKHLAHMEDLWFQEKLRGVPMLERWVEKADPDWDFHSAREDSVGDLRTLYAAACARSRSAAALFPDLDHLAARTSFGGKLVSLRWILVHMIEETAQHRGHLDLLRDVCGRPAE
jgi:uncharacterized damage-inducible protein DinB